MNQVQLNQNYANAICLYLKQNNIAIPSNLRDLGIVEQDGIPTIMSWNVAGIVAPTNTQLLQYTIEQVQQQQTYYVASQQANAVVIPTLTTTDLNNLTNVLNGALAYDTVKHQIVVYYNSKWN